MHSPRLILLVAVAAIALAVSACGGSDRADYAAELAKVGGRVDAALEDIPASDRGTLGPQEVEAVSKELRGAADELDGLDAPDDAAKPQARMVKGMRGVADAFDTLARDLERAETDEEKGQLFVAFSADADVEAAFEDISGAQESFAEADYRVFGVAPAAE